MNKEQSLEEDIRHGTKRQPLAYLHFITGPGTVYPDGFYVQRHWHHSMEILKIQKGTYQVELNLENHVLKEGDLCMINSGELHKIDGADRDTMHDVLIFDPHILDFSYGDELQEEMIGPLLAHTYSLCHIVRPDVPGYANICRLYDRTADICRRKEKVWYPKAKLSLMELMLQFYESGLYVLSANIQKASEKEKIDRYKRVVSHMTENLGRKVTLQELADVAGCNPQYLCHFFKEIAGVSPVGYLITLRLEAACSLLENTTKSVLEVSLDCGFENVSYFIRKFKQMTGMTPREYRMKGKGKTL